MTQPTRRGPKPYSTATIAINFRVTPEAKASLESIAQRNGEPVSFTLRRWIAEGIERETK